jgi:hypothetical protein
MRKLLSILFALISFASFGQTVRVLQGYDAATLRPGTIYRDTLIALPYTPGKYITGYATVGSQPDSVRGYFSGTTNRIAYNSTTGVFDIGSDVVTLLGTQSLTNKTLISPIFNTSSTSGYVWTATNTTGAGGWAAASGGGGGGIGDSINFWPLTGKSIAAGGSFLGTTNNTSLRFRTNNTEVAAFDSTGYLNLKGGTIGASPIAQLQFTGNYYNSSGTPKVTHISFSSISTIGMGLSSNSTDYIAGTNNGHRFYANPALTALMILDANGNITLASETKTISAHKLLKASTVSTLAVANSYLHLGGTEDGAGSLKAISFGYGGITNYPVGIVYAQEVAQGSNYGNLRIYTRPNTQDIAPTERARWDKDGRYMVGTTTPDTSSIVDFASTTKGFSCPRMTTTQRNALIRNIAGTISGGSGYTATNQQPLALTGGTGTGATASVNVTGGIVTSVFISNPGSGYIVGDVLSASANLGSGTGFTYTLTTVNPPNEGCTVYDLTLHKLYTYDGTIWQAAW